MIVSITFLLMELEMKSKAGNVFHGEELAKGVFGFRRENWMNRREECDVMFNIAYLDATEDFIKMTKKLLSISKNPDELHQNLVDVLTERKDFYKFADKYLCESEDENQLKSKIKPLRPFFAVKKASLD